MNDVNAICCLYLPTNISNGAKILACNPHNIYIRRF
nr:MAG TPA: hypothetical protein [Caudoviricetes sp.]